MTYEQTRLWELVEELLDAKADVVRAGIDASCCQTSRDWQKLHEKEEECYRLEEELTKHIDLICDKSGGGYYI